MRTLTPADFAAARPGAAQPTTRPYVSPSSAAGRSVARVFGDIVRDGADLTVRQAAILALCVAQPGTMTGAALAEALVISRPAVTRSLHRLQQLGFAQRRTDPANGAQVLVDPTADGCAWVATVAKTLGQA